MFPRIAQRTAAALAAVAAGFSGHAWGDALELVPTVQVGATYETNPRFKADCSTTVPPPGCGPDYVTGTFVDAELTGRWRTPDGQISLAPRIRDWNFLGSNKDLNNNDFYITGIASQKLQRLDADVTVTYSDTLIRQQLLESATPSDPNAPPPTIGTTVQTATEGATEQRWVVRPALTYQLSSRNELGLQIDYSDLTFDERANFGFFDFDATSASLSLTHNLDARNAFQVGINGSTFDADNFARADPIQRFANTTDSYGFSAVYQHVLSQTLSATFQVGTARNTVVVDSPLQGRFRTTDSTLLGNIGLRKRSEKTTLNFDVGRSQVPRSDGRQITQDEFRFFVDRAITGRFNAQMGILGFLQSGIGDFDRFDQDFYTVDFTGSYRIERDWTVLATYSLQDASSQFTSVFNQQQNVTSGTIDQSNRRILITVTYRGLGYRR